MTHGDDDGLVMPPRLAPYQIVILPIIKGEDTGGVMAFAEKLSIQLKAIGVRVQIDKSEHRAPDKMWNAIKRGVPIRVEIGEREVAEGKLTHTRRDLGRDSKTTCTSDEFLGTVKGILDAIHTNMYETAKAKTRARVYNAKTLDEVKGYFTTGELGFVRMPVEILDNPDYQAFKKENSLSSRCLPFEDEGRMVLIGKSY
jgi:prolyl-tRNA synthetase